MNAAALHSAEPWTEEEIAWAHECAAAGDTLEEIAACADRAVEDVRSALGDLRPMTDVERLIASLWAAGVSDPEAARQANKSHGFPFFIRGRLRAAGYRIAKREKPAPKPGGSKLPPGEWQQRLARNERIAAAISAGTPQVMVARQMDVSTSLVAGVAKRRRDAAKAQA